ncbi:MAG: hypothetical protein ACTTHG_03855 [Treponemataceae bacterium]
MKKYFIAISILFFTGTFFVTGFALPGITEYISTESGQYVYYRDYSRQEESYIGFLYYDESTISARYFSKDAGSKDIYSVQIYFKMNPSSNHIEFTGEKLPENTTNADIDSINYIHDMIYELSAKRMKVAGNDFSKIFTKTQDFFQFDGEVIVTYDFSVPIFNVNNICAIDGKVLFEAVSIGAISSNTDNTFDNFSGFEPLPKQIKPKNLSKKQMEAFKWQDSPDFPETLKTLGNNAIIWIFFMDFPVDDLYAKNIDFFDYFSRSNRQSLNGSYVYFPSSKIKKRENKLICDYILYSPMEKNKFSHVIKILTVEGKEIELKVISVYDKFYQENKLYFDTLQ